MTPLGCQELSLPSLSRTVGLGSQSGSCPWERQGHAVAQEDLDSATAGCLAFFPFVHTETATREKEPGRWLTAPE